MEEDALHLNLIVSGQNLGSLVGCFAQGVSEDFVFLQATADVAQGAAGDAQGVPNEYKEGGGPTGLCHAIRGSAAAGYCGDAPVGQQEKQRHMQII